MVRKLGIGGCERDLTKVAIGLDRTRFEPHVACFRSQGMRTEELRAAGIPVVELPVRRVASPSTWSGAQAMARYISRNGIRLVHCFDVPSDLFGVPVARASGARAVASQFSHRALVTSPLNRALLRLTDRLADAVVVNSEAVGWELETRYGVDRARIRLCYNGVDTRLFRPLEEPRPEALEKASLVIGSVCGLRPEKNLPLLVEAFAALRLGETVRLAIVGSGPMLAALVERSRALGIEAQCHFEPATQQVAEWMRAIDIFVLPSATESMSNALLEAMACGCCVVASRVGGTPEAVEDEVGGLLFEPGDVAGLAAQLERVVRDPGLRRRLARAGMRRVHERFPLAAAVRRIEEVYASVLAPRNGRIVVPSLAGS